MPSPIKPTGRQRREALIRRTDAVVIRRVFDALMIIVLISAPFALVQLVQFVAFLVRLAHKILVWSGSV